MQRLGTALLLVVLAQLAPTAQQHIELIDEAKLPRFEVASVRPGDPKSSTQRVDFPPGRFVQENTTLVNIVSIAFDVPPSNLADPLPDVVTREPFSIEARMPVGSSAADLRLMLRSLLIDRFKLRAHVVSREQDAYALTVASPDRKLGPQMRSSGVDCVARAEAQRRNQPVSPQPEGSKPCGVKVAPGRIDLGGMPVPTLAQMLSRQAGRPVVDRTGLGGPFDVDMQWSPTASGLLTAGDATPALTDGPSIFTAVHEQLGLKLQPSRTSVDYLVIDHIERPDPN